MTSELQLNEVVDIISGMSLSLSDTTAGAPVPVINASYIKAGEIIDDFSEMKGLQELPKRSPAIAQNKDILMVSRATPNSPFKSSLLITEDEVIATSSLYILRVKDKTVIPEYLNYYINSDAFQKEVLARARGSTISHISRSRLEEIKVVVPDVETQKTLVDMHQNLKQQKSITDRKQTLQQEIIQQTFINLQQA